MIDLKDAHHDHKNESDSEMDQLAETKENTVDNRENTTGDNRTVVARDFIENGSEYIKIDSDSGLQTQIQSTKQFRIGHHALHNRYKSTLTAPQHGKGYSHPSKGFYSEQLLKMNSQIESEHPSVSEFNVNPAPVVEVESPKIIRQKTKTQTLIDQKEELHRISMLSGNDVSTQGVTNEERYNP